jgi:hypothetical protein
MVSKALTSMINNNITIKMMMKKTIISNNKIKIMMEKERDTIKIRKNNLIFNRININNRMMRIIITSRISVIILYFSEKNLVF